MTNNETLGYWLALSKAPQVGYKSFGNIIERFPNLMDFFSLKTNEYQQLGYHPKTIQYLANPDWKSVEIDLEWSSESKQHSILTLTSQDYPTLLREIPCPPPILFVKGELSSLNTPQVAIVGSRMPSPAGKEIALQLAFHLAQAGLTVTSGLALGIDTYAHLGALKASKTIAVMGTGMNCCYPASNKQLAEKISQQGALLTEFSCNTLPKGQNFPKRNQIISGLSLGTLVVEANLKSGSLITASFALEQGREVFAVPGSINNPMTRGCHLLLKQGAKLVESAQDVLEELYLFNQKPPLNPVKTKTLQKKTLEEYHTKLLECVGYEPTKIDILVERSNYSIPKVASMLADLELAGFVSSTVSGYMRVS